MKNIQILIVEDEVLQALTLSRKLQKLGYTVLESVTSGEDAIEVVREKHPDIILMDIVIQGDLDGIETAARIYKEYDIPIVYLTAYADDKTLDRAEATGSYGYLLKPPKERELHATIKMALKKYEESRNLQKMLEDRTAIGEEKSHYLAMAAHDFRNPLSAIQLSADMLKTFDARWDLDRKLKHFQRIQRAISTINLMLDEVSALSKVEAGKLPFEPSSFDVVKFCQQLADEFQGISAEKHDIWFHAQGNFEGCILDENLLRHILANLLINAIKYSPDGGTIEFSVLGIEKVIEFRVRDSGIGIPKQDMSTLFDRYTRASNVSKIKGTGLGLYITKQAIDRHRGTINVKSQLGEGTTFLVSLPRQSVK
ncbi:hybrid sensor histidine kinase/response regulator [Baaleninema sp.]|uniref:hybrid sensor histidine kinase/response regulator n=1 Tax=Baaleninema sp. TaxID=3101197 RepID=UPI003CFCC486